MKSLLIGEAAQSMDVHAIREAILSEPIIAEIEDLRTEQLGPDDILVVGRESSSGQCTVLALV